MEFVKLILSSSGNYRYKDASNIRMNILGNFLASDVYRVASFKQYVYNTWEQYTSSNLTALKKEDGYILLSDLYSEEKIPTTLKMSQKQYIQILDDWEQKVITKKPKEVTIKYANDEFTIETKD